jgi:large subunit ribosomal protein L29
MKAKDKVKEFRGMGVEDLKTALSGSERELLNLRFRHAAGQLEQSAQIRALRRQVARARTILVEKRRSE